MLSFYRIQHYNCCPHIIAQGNHILTYCQCALRNSILLVLLKRLLLATNSIGTRCYGCNKVVHYIIKKEFPDSQNKEKIHIPLILKIKARQNHNVTLIDPVHDDHFAFLYFTTTQMYVVLLFINDI